MTHPLLLLIVLPQLASSDAIATVRLVEAAAPAPWSPATNPQQREMIVEEDGRPVLLRLTEYQ